VVSTRESPPFAISAQPNNNIESVVTKTERVRVTLRAKADYSANFAAQSVESDLFIAVNSHRTRVADAGSRAKLNLIGRNPLRACHRLQARNFIARFLCFGGAPHLIQDFSQHQILSWLVGLARNGAALRCKRVIEPAST
jgi:hypothetical protein